MYFEFSNKYRELSIWILVFILLLSLPIRFYFLEKNQFDTAIEKSVSISERSKDLLARRGKIFDRNGIILAEDIPSYEIGLEIKNFSFNPDEIYKISFVLEIDEKKLRNRLANQNRKYLILKHSASVDKYESIIKENIQGIVGYKKYKRNYPKGMAFSQIVGVVNTYTNSGIQGIELSLDSMLSGTKGVKEYITSRKNKTIASEIKEPLHGKNISLTIDSDLQTNAYLILEDTVKLHEANSGSLVVIDPETREILAMANYPSFDPNNRKNISSGTLENKAATNLFEPGSTVKPIVMAVILDNDNTLLNKQIDTSPGYIDYQGFVTKDFRDYGVQNVSQIISNSSNVGMVKICDKVNSELIVNGFYRMGFGKYFNEIFISTREGYLPNVNTLSDREKVSLCYGYGLQTTLLELVNSYSILYSKGKSVPLKLVTNSPSDEFDQILSPEVSSNMENILTSVVDLGTGRRAKVNGIDVSGKTGTVRKVGSKGYEEEALNALFIGKASMSDKDLIIGLIIRNAKTNGSGGGEVAAPSFSKFINKITESEKAL